jgi:O-antigen/teichoic acid export membrane protein
VGYFLGMWAGALAAVIAAPYRVKIVLHGETAREYLSFTWPLLVANGALMLIPSLLIIVGEATLGLAGAGMMTLAGSIASYADRVDRILTETMYPAICRVKDRLDLLHEAFEKSNRLDLMWGVPFGVGIALFAADLVHFGIGDKWEPGIILIQAFALCSAANHIGYNWTAFLRARGDTRPLAIAGPVVVGVFGAVTLPLLVFFKMEGLAVGMAIMTLASLAMRAHFIRRLFPAYSLVRQGVRAVTPVIPATAVVLALRLVEPTERSLGVAIGEAVVFVGLTAAVTLVMERALLREIAGYLRGRARPAFAADAPAAT